MDKISNQGENTIFNEEGLASPNYNILYFYVI